MLDASKAFDRVKYGKLFNLLRDRKLPAMVTRLLLDMTTRQRMSTTWNGSVSVPFHTENGVKRVVKCLQCFSKCTHTMFSTLVRGLGCAGRRVGT